MNDPKAVVSPGIRCVEPKWKEEWGMILTVACV